MLQNLRTLVVAIAFSAGIVSFASAVQPADGFFTGVDLEPIAGASIQSAETEPAVVLMFASDQKTAEISRQFETWFSSASVPGVSVYAIAVAPGSVSRDIVTEAIQQRNLTMPVFLSRVDMLLGDDFRLLVLNNDGEVQRFTTMDFAGVKTALESLGITAGDGSAVQSTQPASVSAESAPPLQAPSPGETPQAPAPVVEPSGPARITGGDSGESVYVNDAYGFQVEFPPGWRYKIAAKNDGAVAVSRPGSRIDMRVWTVSRPDISNPQSYIDERLEALAKKVRSRVNIEARFIVNHNGQNASSLAYSYTQPIDPARPAMGVLLYRGRIQVAVRNGQIIAASIDGPAGEFLAATPLIESFFRSFQVESSSEPTSLSSDPTSI